MSTSLPIPGFFSENWVALTYPGFANSASIIITMLREKP